MKRYFKFAAAGLLYAAVSLAGRDARAYNVSGEWMLYANGAPGTPINFTTPSMGSINDEFCYLTEIQGHFVGLGEGGKVFVGADGNWYLSVWAQQQGIGFHVRCVTWSSFTGSANHSYTITPRTDYRGTAGDYSTAVWPGTSLCYMDLLSGNFDIDQSASTALLGDGYWHNRGSNDNVGADSGGYYVESGTFCAWLGRPVRMSVSYGVALDYWEVGGAKQVPMININQGVCWLDGIQGTFAGGGEQASITLAADGTWMLNLVSWQSGTGAVADCAYYN